MKDYIVLDIETVPIDMQKYNALEEDKKTEMLNPIDSKIIAIGLRHSGKDHIFYGDEKTILNDFWTKLKSITNGSIYFPIVGFNINQFDMPFLTARSFILGVTIVPFVQKQVVELRDKINAYKYGPARGKMKEFAKLIGVGIMDVDGSDVAPLYEKEDFETINKYLAKDLEITEKLYLRAYETKIIHVSRY